MKLQKPVYDAANKVYTCDVQEGIRRTTTKDGESWNPPLTESNSEEFIHWLITSTTGWFTKPITEEWLRPRIKEVFEQPQISVTFEGTVEWKLSKVSISKESFLIQWTVQTIKEAPKVVIEFEEEQPEEVNNLPENDAEILGIGPTRRILHKHKVLEVRAKAARALFKAERMTQEYMQVYGEDTDWEDEDSGNESD
jgi:hypothetical protein